ncbi:hypothetical protein EJ08DRAFT_663386 [Tothia fuscella]|uniref:Uncharacterized protein n=1 Tax=Tothia fuscella TaxID=1048955 RepID=A0A9P4NL56_9PEZI|nr:hypothetical protein EJ08DRAFT_663386 [Tothia fuscella]
MADFPSDDFPSDDMDWDEVISSQNENVMPSSQTTYTQPFQSMAHYSSDNFPSDDLVWDEVISSQMENDMPSSQNTHTQSSQSFAPSNAMSASSPNVKKASAPIAPNNIKTVSKKLFSHAPQPVSSAPAPSRSQPFLSTRAQSSSQLKAPGPSSSSSMLNASSRAIVPAHETFRFTYGSYIGKQLPEVPPEHIENLVKLGQDKKDHAFGAAVISYPQTFSSKQTISNPQDLHTASPVLVEEMRCHPVARHRFWLQSRKEPRTQIFRFPSGPYVGKNLNEVPAEVFREMKESGMAEAKGPKFAKELNSAIEYRQKYDSLMAIRATRLISLTASAPIRSPISPEASQPSSSHTVTPGNPVGDATVTTKPYLMPFGKHEGEPLGQINTGYLKWSLTSKYANSCGTESEFVTNVQQELQKRQQQQAPQPSSSQTLNTQSATVATSTAVSAHHWLEAQTYRLEEGLKEHD